MPSVLFITPLMALSNLDVNSTMKEVKAYMWYVDYWI